MFAAKRSYQMEVKYSVHKYMLSSPFRQVIGVAESNPNRVTRGLSCMSLPTSTSPRQANLGPPITGSYIWGHQ